MERNIYRDSGWTLKSYVGTSNGHENLPICPVAHHIEVMSCQCKLILSNKEGNEGGFFIAFLRRLTRYAEPYHL